nr:MAG TPA: hypothetical protein [Caudoviricetes sp.]
MFGCGFSFYIYRKTPPKTALNFKNVSQMLVSFKVQKIGCLLTFSYILIYILNLYLFIANI